MAQQRRDFTAAKKLPASRCPEGEILAECPQLQAEHLKYNRSLLCRGLQAEPDGSMALRERKIHGAQHMGGLKQPVAQAEPG